MYHTADKIWVDDISYRAKRRLKTDKKIQQSMTPPFIRPFSQVQVFKFMKLSATDSRFKWHSLLLHE